MATVKFTNNAVSTLAGALTNVATTFSVQSGDGAKYPSLSGGDWFMATLVKLVAGVPVNEIVKVTARSGDTFTVVRGQEATTATTFSAGDIVELRMTAGATDEFARLGRANAFTANNTFSGDNTFSGTNNFTGANTFTQPVAVADAASAGQAASKGQMDTALALKAPLASPVFTGDPTGPTPAQFDNDVSLATTAFVQRALGNMAANLNATVSPHTLTAADAGKRISAAVATLNLPATSGLPDGAAFVISLAAASVNLVANGADRISAGTGLVSVANVTLTKNGSWLCAIKVSAGNWVLIGSAVEQYEDQFILSSSAIGYQKLPSGLIIQWGNVVTSGSADLGVSFPIAFPNACRSISFGHVSFSSFGAVGCNGAPTTTGFNIAGYNGSGRVAIDARWIAIGF